MIRCDKCGIFYDELTHNNCPKCGEKKHQSVGKCMLCGKEAERGDVCNKCIKDYQIKAEEIFESQKEAEGIKYKPSNRVDWLNTLAGLFAVATIIGAIAMIFIPKEYGQPSEVFIISELVAGLFSSFLLKCYAEHLEYMEHMTKQLEEIKEIIKLK